MLLTAVLLSAILSSSLALEAAKNSCFPIHTNNNFTMFLITVKHWYELTIISILIAINNNEYYTN